MPGPAHLQPASSTWLCQWGVLIPSTPFPCGVRAQPLSWGGGLGVGGAVAGGGTRAEARQLVHHRGEPPAEGAEQPGPLHRAWRGAGHARRVTHACLIHGWVTREHVTPM